MYYSYNMHPPTINNSEDMAIKFLQNSHPFVTLPLLHFTAISATFRKAVAIVVRNAADTY